MNPKFSESVTTLFLLVLLILSDSPGWAQIDCAHMRPRIEVGPSSTTDPVGIITTAEGNELPLICLLYTSPSPRD